MEEKKEEKTKPVTVVSGDYNHKEWRVKWQEAYYDMCADPTDHRNIKQFAKDSGISDSLVYSWRRKNLQAINEEVNRRAKAFRQELRNKGWKALEKRMDKDTKAVQVLFQLLGDLVERSEQKIDYMSAEDKRERVKELLSKVLEKKDGAEDESPA